MAQVWVYGMYRLGYLPYASHLQPPLNFDPGQYASGVYSGVEEADQSKDDGRSESLSVLRYGMEFEDWINRGAILTAARQQRGADHSSFDVMVNFGVPRPEEDKEMRRRARRWLRPDASIHDLPALNCDDYAEVHRDAVSGHLANIGNCIRKTRSTPISLHEWQRFLDCAVRKRADLPQRSSEEQGVALVRKCVASVSAKSATVE